MGRGDSHSVLGSVHAAKHGHRGLGAERKEGLGVPSGRPCPGPPTCLLRLP